MFDYIVRDCRACGLTRVLLVDLMRKMMVLVTITSSSRMRILTNSSVVVLEEFHVYQEFAG